MEMEALRTWESESRGLEIGRFGEVRFGYLIFGMQESSRSLGEIES